MRKNADICRQVCDVLKNDCECLTSDKLCLTFTSTACDKTDVEYISKVCDGRDNTT